MNKKLKGNLSNIGNTGFKKLLMKMKSKNEKSKDDLHVIDESPLN
jgi:hypothetical protein